jgi:hypothetical protein
MTPLGVPESPLSALSPTGAPGILKGAEMGREVRRVPENWEHPKDENGYYIPMHERFVYNAAEIKEGLREGWLSGDPPYYGVAVMPQWPDAERTHLQMYEDTTEGTPISPVMDTPENLARWLADNRASAFGRDTATYEQWLATIKRGWAPSAVVINGVFQSGPAAELAEADDAE